MQDAPIGVFLHGNIAFGGPLRDQPIEPALARGSSPGAARYTVRDPNSQLATDPPRRMDPARFARTRKTAWNASSASCAS